MRDKVIRDYFDAYRWEKMKNMTKNGGWWTYFYIICIFPVILQVFDHVEFAACYYSVVLPMMWELLESQMLPMGLTKIQYLCPMEEKDRKHYLWGMYWLKVGMPVGLYLMCQIPALCLNWVKPMQMILETTLLLLFSLAIQVNPLVETPKMGHPLYKIGFWRGFAGVWGILIMFLFLFFEEADWEGVLVPAIGGIMAGWQLLLTIKTLTYLKPAVEITLHYENTLGMPQSLKHWRL